MKRIEAQRIQEEKERKAEEEHKAAEAAAAVKREAAEAAAAEKREAVEEAKEEKRLEKKILVSAKELREAKNIYNAMQYQLQYNTLSSEINTVAAKVQNFAEISMLLLFRIFHIL